MQKLTIIYSEGKTEMFVGCMAKGITIFNSQDVNDKHALRIMPSIVDC